MNKLADLLVERENLYAAWQKVRNFYRHDAVFVDDVALAAFNANLETELDAIAEQFVELRYEMGALRPFPYPKRKKEDTDTGVRQYFDVGIRDQVAWVAFVNIIGPWLDDQMPPWSYGNRLHRTAWIEEEDDRRMLRIGWYRHSRGAVYRPFRHSWPLFRRHIYLTVRAMTRTLSHKAAPLDEAGQRALDENKSLPQEYRLPYLEPSFWQVGRAGRARELYWTSIDLEKFYPNVTTGLIADNMFRFLRKSQRLHAKDVLALAKQLLAFTVEHGKWSDRELAAMGLSSKESSLGGIPTGLIVAGFLANVGLLKIDFDAEDKLKHRQSQFYRRVAHFRYVDDHVILARDFKTLRAWLRDYGDAVEAEGLKINLGKTNPESMGSLLTEKEGASVDEASESCRIDDPLCPTPLMTETLAMVSQVVRTDFLLLSEEQQGRFLSQVQHLLITEFPEEEIRQDTRMSFAASVLTRCVSKRSRCPDQLVRCLRTIHDLTSRKAELREQTRGLRRGHAVHRRTKERIASISAELNQLKKEARGLRERQQRDLERDGLSTFRLLEKAVRAYLEKPRLWLHLARFFRISGWGKAGAFLGLLEQVAEVNPLLAIFFRTLLLRDFSGHLLNAAVCLTSHNRSQRDKDAARRFLQESAELVKLLPERRKVRCSHEAVASGMFAAALGMAGEMIKASGNEDEIKRLSAIFEHDSAVNWDQRASRALLPVHPYPQWYIWIDSLAAACGGELPVAVMERILQRIQLSNEICWDLFAAAVQLLPQSPNVLQRLLKSELPVWDRRNEGWLLQVLRRVEAIDELSVEPEVAERITDRLQAAATWPRGTIALISWFDYAPERATDRSYDPRYTEWTSLEIIRQLAVQLTSIEFHIWWQRSRRKLPVYPINPANILVPTDWTKPPAAEPRTWETWKFEVRSVQDAPRRYKCKSLVQDARYWPSARWEDSVSAEWFNVYACGLVLLGLLRGTFDLPGEWGRPSRLRIISGRTHRLLSQVRCSSHTLAILQACLLERPHETLRLPHQQKTPPNIDTTYDPPQIPSLDVLVAHLNRAQHTLELHQVTVQKHLPRQLVPVNLCQLARPSLLEEGIEEDKQ